MSALLRRLGVQTQSSAFFVRLTAWEHLGTVAALYGLAAEAAARALELVGLTGEGATPGSTTCPAASASASPWPPRWSTSRS